MIMEDGVFVQTGKNSLASRNDTSYYFSKPHTICTDGKVSELSMWPITRPRKNRVYCDNPIYETAEVKRCGVYLGSFEFDLHPLTAKPLLHYDICYKCRDSKFTDAECFAKGKYRYTLLNGGLMLPTYKKSHSLLKVSNLDKNASKWLDSS